MDLSYLAAFHHWAIPSDDVMLYVRVVCAHVIGIAWCNIRILKSRELQQLILDLVHLHSI